MKKQDLRIDGCLICELDKNGPGEIEEFVPGDGDEMENYLFKRIKSVRYGNSARKAIMDEHTNLPDKESVFRSYAKTFADDFCKSMKEYPDMKTGCGIFLWFVLEEITYCSFFYLPYKEQILMEKGKPVVHTKMLPSSGSKNEWFLADMLNQTVYFPEVLRQDVNLMEKLLDVTSEASEARVMEEMSDCFEKSLLHAHPEDAQESLIRFRKELAEQAEGRKLDLGKLSETMFEDEQADQCKEDLRRASVPTVPFLISEKARKDLLKKHKIITEAGIELSIPVHLLDSPFFSCERDADGTVRFVIRDGHAENGGGETD